MSSLKGTSYVFAIAFVASVGGFLFGYDLAIMGGANLFLKEQFSLSDRGFGFTNASAILGCAAGPFLGAWLCDRLGRRRTLIGASYLLAIGAVLTALPRDIYTFNVFRIVGGVGVGLCSIASPMYIAEVAPPRNRGAIGLHVPTGDCHRHGAVLSGRVLLRRLVPCRRPAGAGCLVPKWWPSWSSWSFSYMMPETPRWLAARGMEPQALAVLERIGGAEYAGQQMQEIRKSLSRGDGHVAGAARAGHEAGSGRRHPVGDLQQLHRLERHLQLPDPRSSNRPAHRRRTDAIFQYMLSYAFMGVMTLAACFVVDRVGRRPLWIGASALMIAANVLTGYLFHAARRPGSSCCWPSSSWRFPIRSPWARCPG